MAGALQLWKYIKASDSSFNTNGTVPILSADTSSLLVGNYPIQIPSAPDDTAYSMETWLYAKVSKQPDNLISNLRFWGPGSNRQETKVVLWVGNSTSLPGGTNYPSSPKATVSSAAVSDGDSARAFTSAGDVFDWDDTSSLILFDDVSKFLVLQLQVGSGLSVPFGNLSNENTVFHYSYDEN